MVENSVEQQQQKFIWQVICKEKRRLGNIYRSEEHKRHEPIKYVKLTLSWV